MAKYVVGTTQDLPEGSRRILTLGGRSVGVFNVGGRYFAVRNRCPHQGAELCLGVLTGHLESHTPGEYRYSRANEMLRCPWHGWEFDLETGESWFDPERVRVRRYPVTVQKGGQGLQKGPYMAETYPVSVEQEYVVVEIP